jgi:hypothetical protein
MKFFEFTSAYYDALIYFVVPPGRDYTSFEKLIYPFELTSWIFILMFLLIGIFVIFIIERRSIIIQNFVFANDVKSPYLNMLNGIIGGSQHVLPKYNFARFILMNFLLYSIVIRTLYQGSFFELLKSNKRHEPAQTIDEMIERDYKFFASEGIVDLLQSSEAIRKRFV